MPSPFRYTTPPPNHSSLPHAMGDTTLDDLKKLITDLAGNVASIKADQSRLHVVVNKV
jgi:hypothetical protein